MDLRRRARVRPERRVCGSVAVSDMTPEDIVAMARAAQKDERLSDGALYGKLADAIERLTEEIKLWKDRWASADQALDATIKSYEREMGEYE